MATNEKPKPCPFCGSGNIIIDQELPHGMGALIISIVCATCGSRTKPFSELGFAITRWNTRKAQTEIAVINNEMRPSYYFRPKLSIDGNKWCLLYGKSLQDGIGGFGNTPEEAAIDFDKNWFNFSSK